MLEHDKKYQNGHQKTVGRTEGALRAAGYREPVLPHVSDQQWNELQSSNDRACTAARVSFEPKKKPSHFQTIAVCWAIGIALAILLAI